MIVPGFQGGLGNIMFQLASSYSFAKQLGYEFGIDDIPVAPEHHSLTNYADAFLKPWLRFKTSRTVNHVVREEDDSVLFSTECLRSFGDEAVVRTVGYFQHACYVNPYKDEILPLFDLNTSVVSRYADIDEAYFLHVRRGDYVGNPYHEMNLENYYKRSVSAIGAGLAYIVSNDHPWCEEWSFLKDIRHRFVAENDVDTLSIMAHCAKGGVAANSSFSWWGLYLNTSRKHLLMPSVWFPTKPWDQLRYIFPEATVVTV
jgi:hypothetical protein